MLGLLAVALLVALLASLGIGRFGISPARVGQILLAFDGTDAIERHVVLTVRLPRVLTATANGTTIGLKFMERLTVRLTGASASTGYSWKVITTETSWLKPYAHEVLLNDCGGTAAGCGQVDEFSYDPTGSDGALEIGLFAPGASTPAERFKLAYVAPVPIALPGA